MNDQNELTYPQVITATAKYYGMHEADLLGLQRHKTIAHARHVAMFLCYTGCRYSSYPTIARTFHRDHTSVMSAVAKVRTLLTTSPLVREQVVTLRDRLARVGSLALERQRPALAASYADQLAEVGS